MNKLTLILLVSILWVMTFNINGYPINDKYDEDSLPFIIQRIILSDKPIDSEELPFNEKFRNIVKADLGNFNSNKLKRTLFIPRIGYEKRALFIPRIGSEKRNAVDMNSDDSNETQNK
jgi:hypothetical protein